MTKSGLGPPIDKGNVFKSLQKTSKDSENQTQCLARKRNFKLSFSLFYLNIIINVPYFSLTGLYIVQNEIKMSKNNHITLERLQFSQGSLEFESS